MIVYYESQPTGKAELLVANVVSIEVSGGVAAAIAGLEVDFQFDCVGNLLTTHGSFPGHVPGGNLVTVGLRFPLGPPPTGKPWGWARRVFGRR